MPAHRDRLAERGVDILVLLLHFHTGLGWWGGERIGWYCCGTGGGNSPLIPTETPSSRRSGSIEEPALNTVKGLAWHRAGWGSVSAPFSTALSSLVPPTRPGHPHKAPRSAGKELQPAVLVIGEGEGGAVGGGGEIDHGAALRVNKAEQHLLGIGYADDGGGGLHGDAAADPVLASTISRPLGRRTGDVACRATTGGTRPRRVAPKMRRLRVVRPMARESWRIGFSGVGDLPYRARWSEGSIHRGSNGPAPSIPRPYGPLPSG